MSSTTSRLFEKVDQALLEETNTFSVVLVDTKGSANKYESPVQIDNPFDIDWSRFIPNQIHMDLNRFWAVAAEVVEEQQKREGIIATEQIQIVSDFPDESFARLGDEVITRKVIRRNPANMNSSATGRPQRKATYSYDLRSPKDPNKVIIVETRLIDQVVEFSCWSKNADMADRRVDWLQNLFETHAWAFKIQGADRFYWQERGIDTYQTTSGGTKLYKRPLRFFVRLAEFQVRIEPVIRHISFEIHDLKS